MTAGIESVYICSLLHMCTPLHLVINANCSGSHTQTVVPFSTITQNLSWIIGSVGAFWFSLMQYFGGCL